MSTSISQKTSDKTKSRLNITRRSWSVAEEHALVASLKDIVSQGWKSDNGFKTGYLGVLEQHMNQKYPGTNLKADPHILSKIHVWKKQYGSLSTMLTRSGFCWNNVANTIDVIDDQVWDEYVKYDSNARTMRYKSWPFFNDWTTIFGKDRATGENAEALRDAVNELEKQDKGISDASAGAEYNPFLNAMTNDDDSEFMSSMHAEGTSSSRRQKAKKKVHKRPRLHEDIDARIVEMMSDMTKSFAETNSTLGELAKRIGFEHDASTTRKKVLDALSTLQLTVEDKISVAKAVCNSPNELDIFFGLDKSERAVMVKMILEGRYLDLVN